MISADGTGVIAFNGEIYNYVELAPRVTSKLRSTSDTEVLLERLRARGLAALEELRGMFAFAYWDGERLHVARDRLGIKPLFFAEQGGRLYVASEIEALIAMGVVKRVDPTIRDAYLSLLYVPPPRTGLQGVHQLLPGHQFSVRPGESPASTEYWRPPTPVPGHTLSDERILALLDDAVRSHLIADVPVGVLLSGGLDSSLIVALASRHSRTPVKTFTVLFGDEGKHLDEREYARAVAKRFRTEHHELHVSSMLADRLPAMVRHFGQPFGNPTALLTWAICEEARKHVKVLLAGDGGDELFGGYPRYQAMMAYEWLSRVPRALRRPAEAVARAIARSQYRGSLANRLARLLVVDESPARTYARWVTHEPSEAACSFIEGYASGLATADLGMAVDLRTFLPNNVLCYGDRMSMAASVEVRVPFCDHLLVEELARLPADAKMGVRAPKQTLRRIATGLLPRRVVTHRKVGFNPPVARWVDSAQRGADSAHVAWAEKVYAAFVASVEPSPGTTAP
jgi:asparagine synthase (glutamine-hydrolysing)